MGRHMVISSFSANLADYLSSLSLSLSVSLSLSFSVSLSLSRMSPEELANFSLTDTLGGFSETIHRKAIYRYMYIHYIVISYNDSNVYKS